MVVACDAEIVNLGRWAYVLTQRPPGRTRHGERHCETSPVRIRRRVLTLVAVGAGRLWAYDGAPLTGEAPAPAVSEEITSSAVAADLRRFLDDYKAGEAWPRRNFQGLDFVGPFLPYALLTTSFPAETSHRSTLAEIGRWNWASLDERQDNYPLLFGLVGLAAASTFLPVGDSSGSSWELRLDRATVLALGLGVSMLEGEVLKPVSLRTRARG